jgi:translocation and assembly module TamB
MSGHFIKTHWGKFAITIVGLQSLLLILLGGISFVLNTHLGTQWVLSRLTESFNSEPAQSVSFEQVSGTLFRGLSFGKVELQNSAGVFLITDLSTSWNPFSLLAGQFILSNLEMSSITIDFPAQDSTEPSQKFTSIGNPIPLKATIERLQINQLEINASNLNQTIRNIKLTAELNNQQLNLSNMAFDSEELSLTGNIRLGFGDYQPLQSVFFWSYHTVINDQAEEISGQLELQGDLRSIQVEHQLFAPFIVQSSGVFIPGLFDRPLEFELVHSTDSLVLPAQSQSQLELSDVALISKGDFTELSLDLQSTLLTEFLPTINVDAQAIYKNSAIDIGFFSFSIDNDSLSGAAVLDWSASTHLSGNYVFELENIASLTELPEQLDLTNVFSTGTFDSTFLADAVTGNLVIQELTGQLEAYPLAGQGSLKFGEGAIEINQLQLHTQNNELLLSGVYADELDFSWELNANSLEEIFNDISGELIGTGNLTGDVSSLDIGGQLSGRNLAYKESTIDQFNLSFARISGQIQSQLDIYSLVYSDSSRSEKLSALNLRVTGTESAHQIILAANSDYGNMEIELAGNLSSPNIPSWQGRLLRASAETVVGRWIATPSSLEFSDSTITIGDSCWNQRETTLCISMQQEQDGTLQATSSIENYPLRIFNEGINADFTSSFKPLESQLLLLPKLPAGVTVNGAVNGNFSMVLQPGSGPVFDFSLSSDDSRLLIGLQEQAGERSPEQAILVTPQEYFMEVFTFTGSSNTGQWQLNAQASFLRENIDDSELDVRGDLVGEFNLDANQALTGTINAGLEDLRWLEAFVPEFSNIDGALNGQVILSGSIKSPSFNGTLELEGGAVSFNRLGISLTDISASIASLNSASIQFAGSASSNSGSVQYRGELLEPLTEARLLTAEITGSNFQLINIPDLQLEISPALTLSANSQRVELNGDLNVPIFNLTLEELPASAIDVSKDVVIVNYPASRPDLARSIAASDTRVFDIPLSGTVDILLGDEVSFNGFGIKTKLAGNLNIQQSINGSNLTYGELSLVDGQYRLYGRSLAIQQGKFLFFGAYDNPGIDVKATREVNGQTVGVLMNGTLKNINSQLFSTPALVDSDIISVLVTGRPFSQLGQQEGDGDALLGAISRLGLSSSAGLTNQVRSKLGLDVLAVSNTGNINNSVLTIGKYITPDIFVRYGVGLFDSQSKVTVDYSITDRVKLQAESGEYQSVDIIYSVEQ